MKIIKPLTITSLTASSSDINLPVANLLNDSASVYWRAATDAVTSATIEFSAEGTIDAVCLHSCLVGSATLEWWDGDSWEAVPGLALDDISNSYTGRASFWWDFSESTGALTLRLTLTRHASAVAIRAGCLAMGKSVTVTGVQYPLAEGMVDTSLQLTMSDGSINYRPRARWRTFSGTILADRAAGVPAIMRDVAWVYGSLPMPIHLIPGGGDNYFLWGRLMDMPAASHAWPTLGQISFSVVEVL